MGIPFDNNSSFLKGPAEAPPKIRDAFNSFSTNKWTEKGIDLESTKEVQFLDDLKLTDNKNVFSKIENNIAELLNKNNRVISLGGDHSITYPIIKAFGKTFKNLNILHFDAHPDLYDILDGNRYSHACPFARIMENKLATRLVQVGIRSMNGHQCEQAKKFGVEVIDMKNINNAQNINFDGPVYLSLDLDCLDPAFAPGVSHHEPGGLSTRELLKIIHNFSGQLVGADIVEYNPNRDLNGVTGMVAAKLLKEIIGKMIS